MNPNLAEHVLAAQMLDMASDAYANHGCNDFDLSESIPDKQQRDEFVMACHVWNGDPEEYTDINQGDGGDYRLPDFAIMKFLSTRFLNSAIMEV